MGCERGAGQGFPFCNLIRRQFGQDAIDHVVANCFDRRLGALAVWPARIETGGSVLQLNGANLVALLSAEGKLLFHIRITERHGATELAVDLPQALGLIGAEDFFQLAIDGSGLHHRRFTGRGGRLRWPHIGRH